MASKTKTKGGRPVGGRPARRLGRRGASQDMARVAPTGVPESPPRGDEDLGGVPSPPPPPAPPGEGQLSDIDPQDIGGSLSDDV
jgi:hypothetical protein